MRRLALVIPLCLLACARASVTPDPGGPFPGMPMVELSPGVFAEATTTAEERARLVTYPGPAREVVARTFGPPASPLPLVVFCRTERCNTYFVGPDQPSKAFSRAGIRAPGATFTSTGPTVVVLRVDPGAMPFLAHELTHLELHARLHGHEVPAWFDDGVATAVSDTPDCAPGLPPGIDDLRRLDVSHAFETYANFRGTRHALYCQLKAEVAGWVARHGPGALAKLVEALGQGGSFDALYGRPAPRPASEVLTPTMSTSFALGDPKKPFTLAVWVKPREATGVLAHLSETPVGSGWSSPLLGFDREHRVVAQLLGAGTPELASFTVARTAEPLPPGGWAHLAMTWSPGGRERLYLNGALASDVAAGAYYAAGAGRLVYLTWGSYNLAGPGLSWSGAIEPEPFRGFLTGEVVLDRELSPDEVRRLAEERP